MADSRGGALLRVGQTSSRATFLELFFDLVFVFALTRVSQRLLEGQLDPEHHRLIEAGQATLLFLALWLFWALIALVTSRYEPERPALQVVVVASMFASMVMAISLPEAFGHRGWIFVSAYLGIQVGRPLFLTVVLFGHPRSQVTVRILCWSSVAAIPWIVGAFAPEVWRAVFWTVALGVEYAGLVLGWPVPRWGPSRLSDWSITGEHLAERYQQFFLIALGEMILVIGIATSETDLTRDRWFAFVMSFVVTVLLWRVYFHRAGHLLAEAVRVARRPGRLSQSATYTHLVMVAGVVVTAVGCELAILHPTGPADPYWGLFILGGPTLFLLARARFEYEIFGGGARLRVLGAAVLVAVAPLLLLRSPSTVVLTAVVGVLFAIAVTDSIRTRAGAAEPPASPF